MNVMPKPLCTSVYHFSPSHSCTLFKPEHYRPTVVAICTYVWAKSKDDMNKIVHCFNIASAIYLHFCKNNNLDNPKKWTKVDKSKKLRGTGTDFSHSFWSILPSST